MTLTLTLPHDLEYRLSQAALHHGLDVDDYALHLLDQSLPTITPHGEVGALLQSWIEDGDAVEQRETGEYLIESLDAERETERPLFPPELKGVTW